MIQVKQTKHGEGKGNCYQAAMASIMELSLDEVPDFYNLHKDPLEAYTAINDWLRKFGLYIVCVPVLMGDGKTRLSVAGWQIMSGPNHDDVAHAVVGYNGQMIYNPNPYCKGLKRVEYYDLFVTMRPQNNKYDCNIYDSGDTEDDGDYQ